MPKLYFLEAADKTPLTKTFTPTEKSSYPNVYEVTSHEEDCPNIDNLVDLLRFHGGLGRCLLKGGLSRRLVAESRAGSTNPAAATSWICLDLDDVDMVDTDVFMSRIGLGDVSYVRQWSPSMGLTNATGKLRCHLFSFLKEAVTPARLKQLLMHLNFSVPELSSNLALSSTGMALRWTLDVTTCQEDKLLYIAPPILKGGLVDPYLTNRYELVKKSKDFAELPASIPSEVAIRAQQEQILDRLRATANLPPRKKWDTKRAGAIEYLPKPDAGTITGMKRERGFVYFNLNGGDSWAYFHPEKNPYYIHNFKGEPPYKTEEFLPEYWAELKGASNKGAPSPDGKIYLVFRVMDEDCYYNAVYDSVNDDLQIAKARGQLQLRDFMLQYGQIPVESIPDWKRVFDPASNVVVDPVAKVINTFKPSRFMKRKPDKTVTAPPPLIKRVVEHMCAYDMVFINWYYNWLAFQLQFRQASGVAPVLHGTEGTGKGLFYHNVIAPIFGEHNCQAKRLEELSSEFFSGTLEESLFILVDEVQVSALKERHTVAAKLKSLITEPWISIRQMRAMPRMARNYCNYMFASNQNDPVELSDADRRYSVSPPQPVKLATVMTDAERASVVDDDDARFQFYSFLMNWNVDLTMARTALANAAKAHMVDLNRATIDAVAKALNTGDIQFFVDGLPDDSELPDAQPARARNKVLRAYVELVDNILATGEKNLTRGEVLTLCRHCIGDGVPESPHKFASYLRHHDVNMRPVWRSGRTQRGVSITAWNMDADWAKKTRASIASLVDAVKLQGY